MTTQSNVLALQSALKSGKRPPPLNQDDLEPLLSASLKVQFSPAMLSPHVKFPRTPKPSGEFKSRSKAQSALGDNEFVQYAFETTKLPADVPTATFDGPLPSKFSSSESSSSDSDDSLSEVKPRQRSVRFSLPAPHSPIPRARTRQEIDRALSFLPHSGSPYIPSPKARLPRLKTVFNENPKVPTEIRKRGVDPVNRPKSKSLRRPTKLLVPESSEYLFAPPGLMGRTKLSPVEESPAFTPSMTVECPSSDGNTDSTTSTLTTAFWGSLSVEHSLSDEDPNSPSTQRMPTDALLASPTVPKPALLSPQLPSGYPLFLYGKTASTFWDPSVPRARTRAVSPLDYDQFPFSPATTVMAAQSFRKMTSPAPNDLSFPSLATVAEIIDDGIIAFPPGVEMRVPPSPRVRI